MGNCCSFAKDHHNHLQRHPLPFTTTSLNIFPTTPDVLQTPKNLPTSDMTVTVPILRNQLTWELNRAPSYFTRLPFASAGPQSNFTEDGTTSHIPKIVPALPPELLTIIFLFAHHHRSDSNDHRAKDMSRLPLTISQVSQIWRDVAVDTAVLWTDIYISPPCSLDLLRTYLIRSRSCSIDLNIFLRYHTHAEPTQFDEIRWVIALFSILGPHLHQCHSISMECLGDWGMRDKLLELFSIEPFPRLQRFAINNPSAFFHLSTSALEELRIKNCTRVPDVRLDGITVLHLDTKPLSYDSLRDLLLQCPALTILALYDKYGSGRSGWPLIPPINVISLPNLRSLQLYAASMSISGKLLFIDAPNLDDLVIAPAGHKDLISFLARWGENPKFPLLKSLTVTLAEPNDYDILPLAFKTFAAVENLTLSNLYSQQFSCMFAALVEGLILWPQLRTLALRGIDRLTEDVVVQMVQFRKSQGYPLDTLYLDYESLGMHSLPSLRRQLVVKERDVWEIRRREAMYSEFPKRFDSLDKTWELE